MCLQRWPSIVPAKDLIPDELLFHCYYCFITHLYIYIGLLPERETDRYFIDRKKVNPNLFVMEIRERYVHVYTTSVICSNHMTIYIV